MLWSSSSALGDDDDAVRFTDLNNNNSTMQRQCSTLYEHDGVLSNKKAATVNVWNGQRNKRE